MKIRTHIIFIGLIILLGLSSCSVGRHLQPNEYVLYKNQYDIVLNDSTISKKDVDQALNKVKNYASQTPNKRVLGLRFKMRLYCMSNPDKNNWLHRFLRKNGEAPIVIEEGATLRTEEQIIGLLNSKGCFNSQVKTDTVRHGDYDMTMHYTIYPTTRYIIDEVVYRAETKEIIPILNKEKSNSYIKEGICYDQDLLAKERDRLSDLLQNQGYYLANPDLITFLVDTTYAHGLLSIEVMVHNPIRNKVKQELQQYKIGDVYIYPNSTAIQQNATTNYDTLVWKYNLQGKRTATYHFLTQEKMRVKPRTICNALFLFDSTIYRPQKAKSTYNALLNLKSFKYIGIEFNESPRSSDTARLVDAHIKLQNNTQQKIGASIELSNYSPIGQGNEEAGNLFQTGNLGLEGGLEYQHRNLFGGAELFKIEGSLLLELPKLTLWGQNGNDFYKLFSSFEAGIDMSIDMPQFLLPFTRHILWQRNRPHTMIALGANYQYRSYFERILTNASFGYNWQQNNKIQHQLSLLEVAYVKFLSLDEQFMDKLIGASDLRLKYMYSDHFVMDSRYTFIYSTQKYGSRRNFNYVNASFESAGNILNGVSAIFNGPVDTNGIRQIFDVPYAQYSKLTVDAKRYFYHGKKSTFVARIMAGIGVPYGNSIALPYEKSFFGGGPLTMRAWQLRHLGPGGYQATKETIERMGDINLLINLEERFPIFKILEGAVFADIGNIWLMNESSEYPNGEWKWDRAWKEMAIGIGIGLRLNVSILRLRLDFAIPLYDPGYAENMRWRVPYWKFNQIVTNFGIDYPF